MAGTGQTAAELICVRASNDIDSFEQLMRCADLALYNVEILHLLKQLGVRIVLDDFGTGYSSLHYLRSFPFDRIKIGQSFIREMCDSREALAIVRAVTGMGKSLEMEVTAEGVERPEQMALLQQEGCSHLQGFLLGRPGPAADILSDRTHG